MAGRKVLFHAVNGNGVGHLVRVSAVASALRCLAPESEIVILTSCEETGIAWREGHTCLKVPSWEGIAVSKYAEADMLAVLDGITDTVFRNLRPDVLFVDNLPGGVRTELDAIIERKQCRTVFNFQYYPHLTTRRFVEQVRRFDRVLCALPPVIRDAMPVTLDKTVTVLPAVVAGTPERCLDRGAARRRLGLSGDAPVVLLAAGGGGNPDAPAFRNRVYELARNRPDLAFAVARTSLRAGYGTDIGALPNVSAFSYEPIFECLAAFDAAVAGPGYNTLVEHLRAGLPTVWCPLAPPASEHPLSARAMADAGLGLMAERPDWPGLEDAVTGLLDPAVSRPMIERMAGQGPFDGADAVARVILRM